MDTTTPAKRPTLLTVLCILTFLFGAFALWSSIRVIFLDGLQKDVVAAQEQLAKITEEQGPDAPATSMGESQVAFSQCMAEHATLIGWSNLASTILTILGAWLMWRLLKRGFWIYLVGALVALIEFIPMLGECASTISTFAMVFAVVFGLAFVVLYAINLKHMR